jgi:hypothetical protein
MQHPPVPHTTNLAPSAGLCRMAPLVSARAPIRHSPREMLHILLPRDGGRDMVLSEDMRGGRLAGDAPGPGAAWGLFARVDLPRPEVDAPA